MYVLSIILSLIFLILSIIHLNWALGGKWAVDDVFPTKPGDPTQFSPPKIATLVVAICLLVFSLNYFINPEPGNPKNWIFNWSRSIIPAIFFIRAIGEFKYVGFFKKVKGTKFADRDSKIYSPLCLVIAIMGIIIRFL